MMYCLRAELRKIADRGSIVNVSSIQGVMGKSSTPVQDKDIERLKAI